MNSVTSERYHLLKTLILSYFNACFWLSIATGINKITRKYVTRQNRYDLLLLATEKYNFATVH